MRSSITASFGLHVGVILLATFGLPTLMKPPPPEDQPPVIDVELVTLSTVTNTPTRPKEIAPQRDDPKPEPPKPEPPPKPVDTPPPAKSEPPPPQPQAVAPPPEPKPAPTPEVKPEPKPEPKPQAPAELNNTKPTKKPKAPEDFDSILKNLAKALPQKAEPKAEAKKSAPQQSFEDIMKDAIPANRKSPGDPTQQLTMNEQDYINNVFRRAMLRCWNVQAGAINAKELVVNVRVALASDGSVTNVKLEDSTFGKSEPWKVAAESAMRAVRVCSPYTELTKIPYDKWRDAVIRFDPSTML